MKSEFQKLVAGLEYPVYVVTTADRNARTGCLVGFATQCSIHPPRFLACISKTNHTFHVAERALAFAVHVVDSDNRHIAELFGGETGDEIDKFSLVRWHDVYGVPVLDACRRWFVGAVRQRIDLGDHVGHVLEPLFVAAGMASSQLTWQQARNIEPGHKP